MKNKYFLLTLVLIICSVHSFSTTYYSIASTGWTTPSTWSTVSCGGAASVTAPGSGDDVIICSGISVTMNGSGVTCNSLTINGTANWTSALTTNVGAGGVNISATGNITGSVAGILTTTGGLTLNATLTSTTVTIRTITTPSQSIAGTGTLARLDISAATTISGNITVTSTLASTVLSTLSIASSGTLTFNGTTVTPNINATASGSTFIYGGGTQTIKSTIYHNLTVSGTSTKTLAGDITVNGNLIISASTLNTSTFQITGNATGQFTIAAAASFILGTNSPFPTNFISSNISFSSTSNVTYSGNNAQTISYLPAYGNLTLSGYTGTKPADGNITINGNLTTTSPTIFGLSSFTLNLVGNYAGTGALSFTTGTFNLIGSYSNTGTFTCGTGTVNYNGTAQIIKSTTYNHIAINGSGQKTLGGATTVNGNLSVNVGSLATSIYQITGNVTGTLTLVSGTALYVGSNSVATSVLFPTNFTKSNISLASNSTVYYHASGTQTVSSVPDYANLIVQIYNGSKTADGTINVSGDLTVNSPTTFNLSSYTLNVSGNYLGTGALSFTSGNFNISGDYTNSGLFTCGTSTTNYNGSGAQAVRGVNYNNLTFSGAGAKTLQAAATIGIAGTFTRGTMTVTPGATNTVTFNGGVQTMTGAATSFTNLVFSNTSLTAPADFTVGTTLTVNTGATLNMTSSTLTVSGNYTGAGALTFSSGVFNLAGAYSNSGAFTCGTGTVNYNGSAAQTVRGLNYYHLTFSNTGSKVLQASSTVQISGDFTRGTMTASAGTANTVIFNGTIQNMTGSALTFTNLTVNNTSLTIASSITVGTTLTLTAGTIITGSNSVIMPASSTVSRTSGFVVGNLTKNVSTGSSITRSFEIGSSSAYTPLSVTFASVSVAGNLTASSTAGDHPAIASSGLNASKTVNRYWTLTNASIVYSNYSVTVTFVDPDKDAGLNNAICMIKMYNGSTWVTPGVGTQTSNTSQALSNTIPVTPNTAYIQVGEAVPSSTGRLYSIASAGWNSPGTWSITSGGASCSCIPSQADTVFIENNYTVTMDGNAGNATALTIQTGGVAAWTSPYTTNIGTGGINITSTGNITGTVAGILTTSGGLIINKVITSNGVTIKTITTANQTISGTGTLAKLDISANTTNNGTLTVTNSIASTVASTLTQSATATLNYNGLTLIAPTLNASAAGNTINYSGGNQSVKSAIYSNLTISGTLTKTLYGDVTVNNNLLLSASTLYTANYQITGNVTGNLTLAAGTTLIIGSNTLTTNILFPTNFTTAHISIAATSLVYYYGNSGQVISSVPSTYGNLYVQNYSGTKAADGNITVAGSLTVTSPSVLDMSSYTLNLTGSFLNTGGLTFTSGTFNIGGAYSNTGTFTCGTSTVNYNGGSGQTIRGVNYYNLTFSGAGTKTLQAANTIGIAGNFARGTMTVTPGATNTVLFNGAAQNMTGSATTFTNVTINDTSLTIASNITINSTLTFTVGNIITGSNIVILPAAGTVLRTSGHVVGNLRKNVATGSNVSRTFEIGTGSSYTPLTIAFTSVSTAGNLTVSTTAGDHPSIASSGFASTLTVNRYWTITNASIVYSNYTVTATFVDADKDTDFDTSVAVIKIYNGSTWSLPTTGTQLINSTQATGITIPVSPNTIYLQIGQKVSTTGNVFSIASNNWTTPSTWSETSGGATCSCLPTSLDSIIIENNFVVDMNKDNAYGRALTVITGGVANWSGAYTTHIGTGGLTFGSTGNVTGSAAGVLTTSGGIALSNAVLSSSAVTIKTIATINQKITGTGTLSNLDIDINTTNNGTVALTDVLTITSSTFTNSGTFTLKADASKYARIAPVLCSGCGFSGDFTIERYIPSRSIGTWANLSSPVSNATMLDWDNELFMSYTFGYVDPETNRPTNTNVMAYDEPTANYYQLSPAYPLAVGKGFEIGLTDDATLTHFNTTVLTTTGIPNSGTFNMALDFTASNGPAYPIGYSGENLIGNPYASAIDLSSITITNALSTVDVFDYTINNYKTLSGSDLIGPHQGFWAYAQGSGASFLIDENCKSSNTATPIARSIASQNRYLNLMLASADGSHEMAHTLKIACNEEANDAWDEKDHPFRKSPDPKAPSITAYADKLLLSISTFNTNHETYIMPLNVRVGINGKYQITSSDLNAITDDFKIVLLEDKLTKQFIDLRNNSNYVFDAKTSDSKERFAVHFSKSATYQPTSSSVSGSTIDNVEIVQNPGGNTIRFNLPQTEQTTISVVDVLGKTIIENQNIEAGNQSISVSLPENFHGMYLIVVQTANNRTVKKFIAK